MPLVKAKGEHKLVVPLVKAGAKKPLLPSPHPAMPMVIRAGLFNQFGMVKDLFTDSPINDHCQYEVSDAESHLSTYTEQLTKPEEDARLLERSRWINWYIEVEDHLNKILLRDDLTNQVRLQLEDIAQMEIPVSCRKRRLYNTMGRRRWLKRERERKRARNATGHSGSAGDNPTQAGSADGNPTQTGSADGNPTQTGSAEAQASDDSHG